MDEADALRLQARNLLDLRRFDDARATAARALISDPGDARSIRLLGEIELAAGDLDAALGHAEAAISAHPSVQSFHLGARIARTRTDFALAIEWCAAANALEPDHAEVYVTASLAHAGPHLGSGGDDSATTLRPVIEAATMAAERALVLDPDLPGAYYARSVCHLLGDETLAAATTLEDGLRLRPDWPDGHVLMGAIRAKQGMIKLASRHFATAGRLNPTDRSHLDRLQRMRGRARRRLRRSPTPIPWYLAPEARAVLSAADELERFSS